ncbi:MAG: hypothetical protein GY771_01360 [bacterium]|nr:hypothetical protein [bacterium]
MKWFTLLLLSVFAFAARGELVDNLASESGDYCWDWPFNRSGSNGIWIAFDYDPDGSYLVDRVKMDWVYLDNVSSRDDMNFAIYLEDFDDPPILTFTVPEEDYTESDTGLTYVTYWDVYRGDIPLGDSAFGVTPGNKYWIALRIDTDESVHALGWSSVVGEIAWWCPYEWEEGNGPFECSYALYGEVSGIEDASLGEIKGSFR